MSRPSRRAKEIASEGLQNATSMSILAGNLDASDQMDLSDVASESRFKLLKRFSADWRNIRIVENFSCVVQYGILTLKVFFCILVALILKGTVPLRQRKNVADLQEAYEIFQIALKPSSDASNPFSFLACQYCSSETNAKSTHSSASTRRWRT